ncbi:uncharacterized protein GGS25DRAFT_518861 [Hypoxylon fragiforme]|uniref:uncharacterized protein n=1 Tax=Hypoxylon fragiforme TaxID=63214 RepID=UPI0020C737CD|nr:uncharacterized protein GGS25DRAFT_518861 [Hypoxylon fragiforme]KAI2613181.1 hypothetical protein GGS25DRAFT_518861 [Hypoxylon fragiforme]
MLIGHITSSQPAWIYIFLIFGAISLAWGILFLAFMPDLPSTARFLNERERIVAVERVATNRQGVKNHHFKAYQMWQCLRDPKTWILFVMSIGAQIPSAAHYSFMSIVSGNVAGYTKKQLTGAFVYVGCYIGNIIGPQTFIETEAPFYTSAYIAILIGYSVETLMVIVLYLYMWSVNRKRDREAAVYGSGLSAEREKEAIERGMQDVTELDKKGFRYVL